MADKSKQRLAHPVMAGIEQVYTEAMLRSRHPMVWHAGAAAQGPLVHQRAPSLRQ